MNEFDALVNQLISFSNDPYGFAIWAFPWGEPGPLETRSLEEWQVGLLKRVGAGLSVDAAIREATTSGNGVGKSALVSIIILWATCTFPDTKGVVTANTETQLKTKTWAELGKWFQLFIAKHFFKLTATALFSRDAEHERTWRCDMVPWSERNVVAFQGLHNEGKRLFMLYDEASGIPDPIWEAGDGCMTDANTQRIWLAFGNPNKPLGRFRDCFPGGRFAGNWHSQRVDSREVSFTDKGEISAWERDWGEDSDYFRVRVKGEFPRIGLSEFISRETTYSATQREAIAGLEEPLVFGVDVARFGEDSSVIYIRKGRDGRTHPPVVLRGADTMQVAARVAELREAYRPDAIFVDGGGVGGGVIDRLRELRVSVFDIQFGGKADGAPADDGAKYANKRAEMWGQMRRWLAGGAIPDDENLQRELTSPQYGFNWKDEILLESKKEMRSRGATSPDIADALALTFAYPVAASRFAGRAGAEPLIQIEYDPFSEAYA